MADIGVLNLTIHDNSQTAADGLNSLASALTAVKTAKANFSLRIVANQIKGIVEAVQGIKGASTIIKNIGTMFNSIVKVSKVTDFAMGADKIRELAESMNLLADAKARMQEVSHGDATGGMKGTVMGEIAQSTTEAVQTVKKNVDALEDAMELARKSSQPFVKMAALGIYGTSMPKKQIEGQTMMDLDGLLKEAEGMQTVEHTTSQASEAFDVYNRTITEAIEKAKNYAAAQEELAKNAEAAKAAIAESSRIIHELEKPIDYSGIQTFIDKMTDATSGKWAFGSAATFQVPALEQGGPFEYAIDEIAHYSEALDQARRDMQFWSQEYDRIAKRIKYNGETAERTMELSWAEKSFYAAVEQAEEYEAHLALINEHIATYQDRMRGTGSIKGIYEDVNFGPTLAGLHGVEEQMRLIEEISKGTGLGIDEIKRQLEEFSNGMIHFGKESESMNGVLDEAAVDGLENFREEMDQVTESMGPAVSKITLLLERIQLLEGKLARLQDMPEFDKFGNPTSRNQQINDTMLQIGRTWEQLDRLVQKAHEAQAAQQAALSVANGPAQNPLHADYGQELVSNLVDNYSEIDLMELKLNGLQEALARDINNNAVDTQQIAERTMAIQRLKDKIEELKNAQDETSGSAISLGSAWSGLKAGMAKMFPTITQLLKRFRSMIMMRSMRYVIRQITAGFREGVENVYNYSKAVGTSLAPAMDQAATALQQMKNSIGAAVAPVIQALVPVLQNVVNWFINVINYANQFFALLNGQSTWTRALPEQAEAFEKSSKSAKNASKAMKDLLADWDELNIIQNQSGGGSGSGTGKTAEEYKNMFEEVSQFDERIKDSLSFIDEYLGGLTGLLKKAGLILLGWKFSKAFAGFLGTLGKLVAGGALVSIGLDLTYGAAYDAGAKGYFDSHDILRAIIGGLATALGGSLITSALGIGGAWGFGIGLMAAAVVTIVGYCQGEKDLNDASKWGNLTYTQDQIKDFVTKQFTFKVDAEIDVMDAHIRDEADAKNKVDAAVAEFNNSLENAEKIVADIDTSKPEEKVAAVKQAATDAKEAIEALKALIDTNEKGLQWTLTNFTFTNENGEDISAALLESIQVSNKTLREYFTGVGEDLAKLVYEGEKTGWKNGEMEAALALMESQKRIYDRADEMKNKLQVQQESSAAAEALKKSAEDGLLSRETAMQFYTEQTKRLQEYRDKVKETVQQEADSLLYFASLAESAAIEAGYDPNTNTGSEQAMALHDAYVEYMNNYNAIMDDVDKAIEDRLKDTKEAMAKEWANTLLAVYGGDYEKVAQVLGDNGVFEIDWSKGLFADTTSWKNINTHNIEETANRLRELLVQELVNPDMDYTGLVGHYINDLGGNVFDLLTDEARQAIADKILQYSDIPSNAYNIFKQMFYIDDETAGKYLQKPEYQDIWSDVLNQNGEPVKPELKVEPKIEVEVNEDDLMEQLKQEVVAALQDGKLDIQEELDLMTMSVELGLGMNALQDVLDEIGIKLDEEGNMIKDRGRTRPMAVIGSAGMSDSGNLARTNPYAIGTQQMAAATGTTAAEDKLVSGMNGMQRTGEESNDLLGQLIRICTQISQKSFTVEINPSARWGGVSERSKSAYGKVTGDYT